MNSLHFHSLLHEQLTVEDSTPNVIESMLKSALKALERSKS